MKPIIILISVLALATGARAELISPFIRAGVDFSKLNAIENLRSDAEWQDKLKGWDTGYFGEAGIKFLNSHTLAAEIGYMKTTASLADKVAGVESREQVPLLLNYRYSINLGPASLYLGASAGMMSDKARWRDAISGVGSSWDTFKSANWVGLYGVAAGVGLKLGKHWAIDAGVRVLAVREKEFQDGVLPGVEKQPRTIGKTEFYYRPNVRVALSLHW